MKETKEKFRFFGNRSDCNHHDIIVTAYSRLDNNILSVSYAFCSDKDKYDKQFGKKIAMQRYANKPCFTMELNETPTYKTIDDIIRRHMIHSKFCPDSFGGY